MTSAANNSGLKPTLMEISWRWNIPRLRNDAVGGFITPGNPPFVSFDETKPDSEWVEPGKWTCPKTGGPQSWQFLGR